MALKKSQLYSSLWQSCDQLRGGMDASQYKDYVLKTRVISGPISILLGAGLVGIKIWTHKIDGLDRTPPSLGGWPMIVLAAAESGLEMARLVPWIPD